MILNLFSDDWDERRSQPGFRWTRTGVGRRLGGELLGASVYELAPGQRSWPYHAHYGNEELLIVLGGRPSLRTPEGEQELKNGDATLFRRGPEGAHQLINRSDSPARFLMISTMRHPDVGRFPRQWEDRHIRRRAARARRRRPHASSCSRNPTGSTTGTTSHQAPSPNQPGSEPALTLCTRLCLRRCTRRGPISEGCGRDVSA